MASRGYDYGGGPGAGGKLRRGAPSRAAAASPYARPAPATPAAVSQGGGWFSRIVAAGASRILPSLFRKPPPQLTAPAPPPPEPLEVPPSQLEPSRDLLPEPRVLIDAPPSPLPPPLEDDLPEGEENGHLPEGEENGHVIGNNPFIETIRSPAMKEDMVRSSDGGCDLDLEALLKQKTFTRSEFDYLSKLLWSRTIGLTSLKLEDGNREEMHLSRKEIGSVHADLPIDFSIRSHSVADQVASPAEIAKAYMSSKSSKGSSLRLRLHHSSLPIKSIEANMMQKSKSPSIPLLQDLRGHTSRNSGCLENNFVTPSRSTIYKMSPPPCSKSGALAKDYGIVSSSYRASTSVHTFGRQILKRKSISANNESVSVGPIRKMRQSYNRKSPLLETRSGCRGYLGGHGSQLDEDPELLVQTQKRRCLDKVGNAALGGLDNSAHVNFFGQAPTQSAEMAAKILKQLDTLVPSQKEDTLEINQKHGNAMDVEDLVSREKEVSANPLKPSPSETKDYSLLNGTGTFVLAAVTEKSVDAKSNGSSALMSKSISQISLPKDKPPTSSLRRHAPSNLVLSSESDQNKMPVPSNGFTFPVPTVLGAHSQAPPTPTMASPPVIPADKAEKQQPSIAPAETGTRILESVSKEGSIASNCDNKPNADDKPTSSKSSGQGASFTCNPVFRFATTCSNGLGHTSTSSAFAVPHPNGLINSASFRCAGSSVISTNSATKPTQSSSTGGSFTFSSTGVGSLSAGSNMSSSITSQPVATPSLATPGTGTSSATLSFLGTVNSSTAQDKSKAVSSITPFNFSQQVGTVSSSGAHDISKAASQSGWFSGNQHAQSGDSKSLFMKDSVNSLSFKSSEKSNCGSSQSSADSPVGSAPVGSSPLNSSSVLTWAAASASTSVPPSATSSAFGTSTALSASPTFGSKLTTPALPLFGMPNSGPTTTFSSNSSAVFSFTSATPSIPNPSPSRAISGGVSPTVQMNGGNMSASPFVTASLLGNANSLPSTPATQFASTISSSPGIFQFGQQSQASSGGFSMGTGGANEKSGRKFIRVKRRK